MYMKVKELSDLKNGNSFELVDMQVRQHGGVNFVSRISSKIMEWWQQSKYEKTLSLFLLERFP